MLRRRLEVAERNGDRARMQERLTLHALCHQRLLLASAAEGGQRGGGGGRRGGLHGDEGSSHPCGSGSHATSVSCAAAQGGSDVSGATRPSAATSGSAYLSVLTDGSRLAMPSLLGSSSSHSVTVLSSSGAPSDAGAGPSMPAPAALFGDGGEAPEVSVDPQVGNLPDLDSRHATPRAARPLLAVRRQDKTPVAHTDVHGNDLSVS